VSGFASHTGVEHRGGGRFGATIDRSWWIIAGPNGGYVAAIVLRAVVAEVGDAFRRPRSATFHYLRAPAEGPVEVEVTVERTGRSVTNVSARMVQGGSTLVTALVSLGVDRPGALAFDDDGALPAPDGVTVPMFADLAPAPIDPDRDIPMRAHYDMRWVQGRWCWWPWPTPGCHRSSAVSMPWSPCPRST
jgi:acyl-CoA thioesterase